MKKVILIFITASLISSCSDVDNVKKVEIPQEGVMMEIPENWSFDESMLLDQDKNKIGEFTLGVIQTIPQIDCEEFMNRLINEGDAIETDKGGYGFERATGGDVFFENFNLVAEEINGKKIFRATSNMTSYGEDGEQKGMNCAYCVELSKNKLFLFDFYYNEDQTHLYGKSDTIMSTVELIK